MYLAFVFLFNCFLHSFISSPPTELQIKTALIYNFLRFTELKSNRYFDNSIVLCSYSDNKLNEEVKKLNGKLVGNYVLRYQEIKSDNEIEKCSVLLVNKRDNSSLKNLLEKTYKNNILTISDIVGYGENGVVINMYIYEEKIKFEINIEASEKAGVKISSRLLALAKIIKNIK